MVPLSSIRIPRVRTYFGYRSLSLHFAYMTFTSFRWASHPIRLHFVNAFSCPKPRQYYYYRFSLFRFRSPLLTESRLISLPLATWMFHFAKFPSCTYVFSTEYMILHHVGSPIRKSTDQLICSSPWLIAACHVLLRLLMPRHSPYALFRLNFFCVE